jgi:hypothetical protein
MVAGLRTFEAVGAATGPPRPLDLPDGREPWSRSFSRHTLALKCEKAVLFKGGRKQKSSFVQPDPGNRMGHVPRSPEEFSNILSMSTFLLCCNGNVPDNKKPSALKNIF